MRTSERRRVHSSIASTRAIRAFATAPVDSKTGTPSTAIVTSTAVTGREVSWDEEDAEGDAPSEEDEEL